MNLRSLRFRPAASSKLSTPATLDADVSGRSFIGSVAELYSECQRRRNMLRARVLPVPLCELRDWSMVDTGLLTHVTGRFFRIIGAKVEDSSISSSLLEQPIIEQSEVGVLCLFVTWFGGEYHGLVTFKFEPGTPDGIEVAPSVQATRSNYEAVHGGTRVPAADLALGKYVHTVADAIQREQESWFLGKVNRNRIVLLDEDDAADAGSAVPDSHWVPVRVLLEASLASRLLNMDLRSVLSMWPLEFSTEAEPPELETLPSNGAYSEPEVVSLQSLSEWQIGDSIEHRQRRFFSIVGCRVEGQGREVDSWDQPLLAPAGLGQCTLLVRHGSPGLELFVTERVRVGSIRGPSLEPRYQRGDISDYNTDSRRRSMLAESADLTHCGGVHFALHAEEGGRFRGALVGYQIGLLFERFESRSAGRWIALREIEALNQHGDRLSVELRTCLTMVKGLITAGMLTP